uniref:Transposase n=1 Tax=Ascaris lumbricoides TaxID=6252 RepID=A0A0M3IHE4_ASCLU
LRGRNAERNFFRQRSAADTVLAQTLYRHQLEQDSLRYGTERGTTWQYMTSHSSWKRGVYEGLVGVVKKTIKHWEGKSSTLKKREMEATLNSRPLTYLYEERDAKTIRPVDFIS